MVRAPVWQTGGHGFESRLLHEYDEKSGVDPTIKAAVSLVWVRRQGRKIAWPTVPGNSVVLIWGYSSFGRASGSQSEGGRFDSD
jgi:hypothetical protein